ncbi:hypothetical protein GQ53DRAFT_814333 [Thozetella sp. PMI_491]|nr:hypothetical protein GQ53DRAFT_814333 [Thozetella sp. PMI_491]
MLFSKSALFTLSSLLTLTSALATERNVYAQEGISALTETHARVGSIRDAGLSDSASNADCDKEDEDDCKEFCSLADQTSTCRASGNKVTCYCKGGKAPASDCEERCLFCMPTKSAFEEAKQVLNYAGLKAQDL